jgi:hypothetical protein
MLAASLISIVANAALARAVPGWIGAITRDNHSGTPTGFALETTSQGA